MNNTKHDVLRILKSPDLLLLILWLEVRPELRVGNTLQICQRCVKRNFTVKNKQWFTVIPVLINSKSTAFENNVKIVYTDSLFSF